MQKIHTILIGDIHGCSLEFKKLLNLLLPYPDAQIVLMGDLMNKGPDPEGVLQLFESLGCLCLCGNHDLNHLEAFQGKATLSPESEITRSMMSKSSYMSYLEAVERMPFYIEKSDLIAVHGALAAGIPLNQQPEAVLTGKSTPDPSWRDHLDLDRPVVVGHKRYNVIKSQPCVLEGVFYGIDTGCVYGGALSALLMPAGKILQIQALQNYSLSNESCGSAD